MAFMQGAHGGDEGDAVASTMLRVAPRVHGFGGENGFHRTSDRRGIMDP